MMMVNELVLFCGLFDWLEIDVEAVMFICLQCIYFRVNVLLDA